MIRMNNIKGRHRMRAMNERQHWGWDSTSLPLIGRWIPYSEGWRHVDLLIDLSKTEGKGISDNWMTLFNRCEEREGEESTHERHFPSTKRMSPFWSSILSILSLFFIPIISIFPRPYLPRNGSHLLFLCIVFFSSIPRWLSRCFSF